MHFWQRSPRSSVAGQLDVRRARGEIHVFPVEIGWHITRKFAAFDLLVKRGDGTFLEIKSAGGADGMGDVGMEFYSARASVIAVALILIALVTLLIQPGPATVTKARAKVIFFAAARAMIAKFPRGHRQEKAIVPVDELHVADDKSVIKRESTKGLESVGSWTGLTKFDSDVRQLHDEPSLESSTLVKGDVVRDRSQSKALHGIPAHTRACFMKSKTQFECTRQK